MKIPKELLEIIDNRKQAGFSSKTCESCNSNCCTGPGFAIYENVVKIYEKYQRGELVREDYAFKNNLSFEKFIFEYFDRVAFENGELIAFFPKTLSNKGELVSVPPWSYYQARDYLHRRYGKLGCIFLKKQFEINGTGNGCILHNELEADSINEKPIDCLFLQCTTNRKAVKPTSEESAQWFSFLNKHFPDSLKNFNQKHPNMGD